MEWKSNLITGLQWSDRIINREGKERIARELAVQVKDGEVIGAGSGSTVYLTLFAIAERIRTEKLQVRVIPASMEISMTCVQLGIPQTTLWERRPDWTFDGADEVDPSHNLIKGRGGAMFKEKLLIKRSERSFILVDNSKFVSRLGSKFPVPVEVFPTGVVYVENQLKTLGASKVVLRMAKGKDGPILTENGNFILDACLTGLETFWRKRLKALPESLRADFLSDTISKCWLLEYRLLRSFSLHSVIPTGKPFLLLRKGENVYFPAIPFICSTIISVVTINESSDAKTMIPLGEAI